MLYVCFLRTRILVRKYVCIIYNLDPLNSLVMGIICDFYSLKSCAVANIDACL